MGGRPCLCSVIQSTPWQARLQRLCVCRAIVACAEIIPAFVTPPPHNLPLSQGKMLTLSFCISPLFATHSQLHTAVSTETGSGRRELSPTHKQQQQQQQLTSFSKSNTSFIHSTQAHRKQNISTVDCQHCADTSVCSSMRQEKQLSLLFKQYSSSWQQLNHLIMVLQSCAENN